MQTKIAVATASGKAYYQLVSELRRMKIPFVTINPGEKVPLNIEAVITTESEKRRVHCPMVLVYDEVADPSIVIREALQVIMGKHRYENLIVGIDPGKDFGIAVVGDRVVLETRIISGEEKTATEVLRIMDRFKGNQRVVKIGSGAKNYRLRLIKILDIELPPDVFLESVEEKGTSRNVNTVADKGRFRDVSSAIMISMRRGRRIKREKIN